MGLSRSLCHGEDLEAAYEMTGYRQNGVRSVSCIGLFFNTKDEMQRLKTVVIKAD